MSQTGKYVEEKKRLVFSRFVGDGGIDRRQPRMRPRFLYGVMKMF